MKASELKPTRSELVSSTTNLSLDLVGLDHGLEHILDGQILLSRVGQVRRQRED